MQYAKDFNYLAHSHGQPILLKFSAEWCAPCKSFRPILVAAASDLNMLVVEVDIDEHHDLARLYTVRGVPTTALVYKGETLGTFVGTGTLAKVKAFLQGHME